MCVIPALGRQSLIKPSFTRRSTGGSRKSLAADSSVEERPDRLAAAREEKDPYWSSVGIVSWHHSIFVARAAAALLRRDPANRSHVATLFTGLAHPLDCVGLETAKAIASLWDIAPQISWAGLGLALELCIVAPDAVGEDMMHDPDGGHEERQRKLEAALAALESGPAPLPIPPVPWVRIESPAARGRTHDATDDDEDWRLADGWWRSDPCKPTPHDRQRSELSTARRSNRRWDADGL